jgi:Flavin-binding monooxygenase-like
MVDGCSHAVDRSPCFKMINTTNNARRVAVIGAGCSGLAAIKNLLDAGLTNLVCFEKDDQLGGNWRYTGSPGHSSVCETTHIISSKALSQFRDFPMPDHYPDYPSHQQVLQYFQDYARTFGLEQYIRYNCGLQKAEKQADERWLLTLSDGSVEHFDLLVVSSGHHAVSRNPDWATDFKGYYCHSHDFRNNTRFAGQRVLVVGAGNSACDCAVETSRVAASVELSVRSPQYIIPKFFMGRPTDVFAAKMHFLPRTAQDFLQSLSLRIMIGRYSDYGLPEPNFPVTKAHPTVNSELLDKIRHGKVRPRPGIVKVADQTVYFTDGTTGTYDAIVSATGYRMQMPFFDPAFLDWSDATNVPLYQRIFHPDHHTLFFIGLVQPQGCIWPLSEAQAKLLGKVLTGQVRLPDNWPALARREGDEIERHFQKSPRHAVEVHFLPYLKTLERMARV